MMIVNNTKEYIDKLNKLTLDNFKFFRTDLKKLKITKDTSGKKMIEGWRKDHVNTLENNFRNTVIFSLPNLDNIPDNNSKINYLPFNRMFIDTLITLQFNEEIYIINGFYILEYKDYFICYYVWSKTIKDGWNLDMTMFTKKSLLKDSKEVSLRTKIYNFENKLTIKTESLLEHEQVKVKFNFYFHKALKILLDKIEKKEYTTYKKWTPSGYETKPIIYAKDVCSHIRHFWNDTDYFNIPKMKKEEWEAKGYGTHELVFKDGELRRDVPYKVINQFTQGEDKPRKETNRVIELFEKKHLRQEEKIYSILRELYPDKIIRRHDRKTLNGIELDFNLPELRLGIEYDGEQHFDEELYKKLYGEGFHEQVRRDREKDKLCRRKNIRLVRIKYDEPITLSNIRRRLKDA